MIASAPGWRFLTGGKDDIQAIGERFGDRSAGRGIASHRNEVLIGNDATGDWQRDSTFDDVSQLVMTIRLMDPNFRAPAGATQANAAAGGYTPIGDQPGQALFRRMCAPCHTIGGGRHIGPDLRGVADRRERGWLTDFIMDPARVLARGDPDAVALAAGYPGVRMPLMGLGETDAADVISYLRDRTARLGASTRTGAAASQDGPGDAAAH